MRALSWLIGITALLAGLLALALHEVDPEQLAQRAAERVSAELAREVTLEHLEVALWPPGLRARNVRVAGEPGDPELVQVESIALHIAFTPLLRGALKLRSLELERPRFTLPVGDEGWPRLPLEPPPAPIGDAPPRGLLALASVIERLRIRGGEATFGPRTLRALELEGRLGRDGSIRAQLSSWVPGWGRLEQFELELAPPTARPSQGSLQGRVLDGDAEALLRELGLAPALELESGTWTGTLDLQWRETRITRAHGSFQLRDLSARLPGARLAGTAAGELALGGPSWIDLTETRVELDGGPLKPGGEPLRIEGVGGSELGALAPSTLSIRSGDWSIDATVEPATAGALQVANTTLDLAAAPRWLAEGGSGAGTLRTDALRIAWAPLRVLGTLHLESVQIPLPWPGVLAELTGSVQSEGQGWQSDALRLRIGDASLVASGRYNPATRQLAGSLIARDADASALLEPLDIALPVSGQLSAELELGGTLDPRGLRGRGRFDLRDGALHDLELPGLTARAGERTSPGALRFGQLRGAVRVNGSTLRLESFQVRDGRWSDGSWSLREIAAEGERAESGRIASTLSARIEGLAQLLEGRLTLEPSPSGVDARVEGQLAAGELGALLRRWLGERWRGEDGTMAQAGAGRFEGPLRLRLRDGEIREASAELQLSEVALQHGSLQIQGAARAEIDLGQRFALDLGAARVSWGESLSKPAGERLTLSGPLGPERSAAAFRNVVLGLGRSDIPLQLRLQDEPAQIEIGRSALDLATLGRWTQSAALRRLSGRVRSEGLVLTLDPPRLAGALQLDAVRVPLGASHAELTGGVQLTGSELAARDLEAAVAAQPLTVSARADLRAEQLEANVRAESVDAGALSQALLGASDFTGTLGGALHFESSLALDAPRGRAEVALTSGRVRGFSPLGALFERLAERGLSGARAIRDADAGRFEQLSATLSFEEGRIDLDPLVLLQQDSRARLRGSLDVPGAALDLSGELELGPQPMRALGGDGSGRIAVEHIGGTLFAPQLELAPETLAALIARAGGEARGAPLRSAGIGGSRAVSSAPPIPAPRPAPPAKGNASPPLDGLLPRARPARPSRESARVALPRARPELPARVDPSVPVPRTRPAPSPSSPLQTP